MSEYFPVDDSNEEEDVDMKEDAEGLEPKGLSPLHKKSKAKKPECSKDSSEDENGPEEKQSAEEMDGQSQEAGGLRFLLRSLLGLIHRDGLNTTTVSSPTSEEAVEVCKDEDSAKDDNITKDNEVTDHSGCDQDHPNGEETDSMKNEMKMETESQTSYMETEELSSNQEDATSVEQPEVTPLTDDQEEKEGEKVQSEDTPRVPVKSEDSSDTENAASPDVEMNSQVDSVNDTTENHQED
ncbi:O-acetyl-ADP-ribose deacetylase MACROD2-like isoform X1 [Tupaia chinensis]|uniref:O-acetyl-ADP-ribose deacetylase MACROD2-like isoform X1 n=1 Tax=Tupaia chinensis TaxID=246437 RepID=UPI0003C900B7|nr:O-acetyl-ADP-ribose deacetylase MACROD2-like isoform X1 [Tupaia chinensis]